MGEFITKGKRVLFYPTKEEWKVISREHLRLMKEWHDANPKQGKAPSLSTAVSAIFGRGVEKMKRDDELIKKWKKPPQTVFGKGEEDAI